MRAIFLLSAAWILCVPMPSLAASYVGEDLLRSDRAEFLPESPALIGGDLYLAAALEPFQAVFRYQTSKKVRLLSPFKLKIGGVNRSCAGGCNTQGGNDHDPGFFVSDGVTALVWTIANNSNGELFLETRSDEGDTLPRAVGDQLATGMGFPEVDGEYSVEIMIERRSDILSAHLQFEYEGNTAIQTFVASLDPGIFVLDRDLSVGIVADDNLGERYAVTSLDVTSVPAPSGPVLLATALIWLFRERSAASLKAGADA